MAHMTAFVAAYTAGSTSGTVRVQGLARTSDMSTSDKSIAWETADIAMSSAFAQHNSACLTAAEAAVEAAGHDVGVTDTRVLFAGAVGA